MNRFRAYTTYVVLATALMLTGVTGAQAQVATFSQLRDAAPGRFFDATTSEPSAANGNQLNIGISTGTDPVTFVPNALRATSLPFGNRMADDTISFVVTAPAGFYVASLTYTQQGTAFASRTAVQNGNTAWTVAGFPASLGEYNGSPNLTGVVDLTALQPTSVPVSITVSLFAGPTGEVEITSANVVAQLQPLAGVARDGAAPGGILQNGPAADAPSPSVVTEDTESRRGRDGRESGRGRGDDESRRRSGGR